ncbi:hypothetical protein JCM10296v2_003375 [Rhodotorula toruloides]
MPFQPPTVPCGVCGAVTTTRCSSCARVSIDLFFCSRDCQKLIWHVHKVVCKTGGRAGPVKVPEISAEEIEDLKASAYTPVYGEKGGVSTYVLEHIAGPSHSTAELPRKPLLVAIIRSSRMSSRHSRFPDGTTPSQPFFWLASQQCRVYMHLDMHDLLPPFFSYKLWHDLLARKLLILAILDSYAATDRSFFNAEGIEALAHGLHQRTIWWDGMDTGDDELVDALRDIGLIKYMDVNMGPLPAGITPEMLNPCLPS